MLEPAKELAEANGLAQLRPPAGLTEPGVSGAPAVASAAWSGLLERRAIWYGLLAAFVFTRGMLFLAVVPPWQGPDEPGHFEYIGVIGRLGLIASQRPYVEIDPELTRAINESARVHRFEEFHRGINIREQSALSPPLLVGPRETGYQRPTYYLAVLPIYQLLRGHTILVPYYGVALTSVLLGVVTVLAASATALTVMPDQPWLQIVVPLLVAFWPTQSYMTTRVTNDNLVTAVAAVTFWLSAVVVRHGLRPWASVGLLAALVLAAYTKGTSLFLVGFGLPVFGYGLARWFPKKGPRLVDWLVIGLSLGAVVVAGLALLDPAFAERLLPLVAHLPQDNRVAEFLGRTLQTLAANLHRQPDRLALNSDGARFTLLSFWAIFGWGRYFLPAVWYQVAAAAAGAALIGWLLLFWRISRGLAALAAWQRRTFMLLVIAIPLALVPLASRMIFDPFVLAFHGRILQTLLTPVAMLLAVGWRQWVPRAWLKASLIGLLLFQLLLDAVIFTSVLLPRFYS